MSVKGTRLLVLGVVRLRQPVHGYQVQHELTQQWGAERWFGVLPGSVYNQFRSLSKAGYIEVDSVERESSRPERTLYRLTRAGEAEFHTLLTEIMFDPAPQPLDLWPVVCFLPDVKESDLRRALQQRIERIRDWVEIYEGEIATALEASPSPHVNESFSLIAQTLLGEVAWSEKLLARIDEGVYTFAPE